MGDVVTLLGSGKDFGCRFTYKVQDEAGGIRPGARPGGENFAGKDPMCVILGDNVFQDPIRAVGEGVPRAGPGGAAPFEAGP